MKPQDIFKIIVATAGLIGICDGSMLVIRGFLYTLNLFPDSYGLSVFDLVKGFIEIILGFILMKISPFIVNIAFPYAKQQDKPPLDTSSLTK